MPLAGGISDVVPMRIYLLSCLLMTALFAGCADDSDVDQVPDVPAPPAEPEPVTLTGAAPFGWSAAVGVPGTGIDAQRDASNAMTMDVPEGAKMLTVVATWTCATPMCDLHFYLDPADTAGTLTPNLARNGAHTMGASPLTLTVEAPAAGEWWAAVHADSVNTGLSGTFAYVVLMSEGDAMEMPDEHDHGGA